MKFRPCIDILGGKVRQIVGSSLGVGTRHDNFVSERPAADYARMYRADGLSGGHVILLDRAGTPEAEADRLQALSALRAFEQGLQVGGGIRPENARDFLDAGASHVIVTSYVFEDGRLSPARLEEMVRCAGRERLVLDFSACRREGRPYIALNRWRDVTDLELTPELLRRLSAYCGEFLVHAVDVEGRRGGIDRGIVEILAQSPVPATYAGGISGEDDLRVIAEAGGGRVDFTVGSALDLFGGTMSYRALAENYHG